LRASKRIEYAKSLLLQGITKDFTIDKVAEMSGFSSRSTFFSTFKEYTGLTPTEFVEKTK
jgi:AraC-like DNA-binding protein